MTRVMWKHFIFPPYLSNAWNVLVYNIRDMALKTPPIYSERKRNIAEKSEVNHMKYRGAQQKDTAYNTAS